MGLFGGKPILRAKISVSPNNEYKVTFEELHPQLQKAEYIRLILCYFAKVLCNFGSGNIFATSELLKEISFIQKENITKNTNIIETAELSDLVKIVDVIGGNQYQVYTVDLIFHPSFNQGVITKFPLKAIQQQTVFSVPVLIQAIIEKLEEEELNVLSKSLRNMYQSYNSGVDFADFNNLIKVPNEAYLNSIMGQEEENIDSNRQELSRPIEYAKNNIPLSSTLQNNKSAKTGFILGLSSILFYWIGIIPILAIIFSIIGLSTFDRTKQKGRWMAITGLIMGILYSLVYMQEYGHINIK
ncbi:DUF4190 domain-containing protein [bacterium]|nr:DUF4190 domain-containing protein [bacterium]